MRQLRGFRTLSERQSVSVEYFSVTFRYVLARGAVSS